LRVAIAILLVCASAAFGEPFGLVRTERGTGWAPVGALDDLLLVSRNGESIDAVDPGTGAVARSFARPASIDRLGSAAVVVGTELWIGAPGAEANRGAVVVYDSGSGAFVRTISPDSAYPDEGSFGLSMAATNTVVAVGAPGSEGGDGSVHLLDAATGALVRRVSAGSGGFGRVVAASEHAFFVWRPQSGFQSEVHQLDENGDLVRVLTTPVPEEPEDGFGRSLALVGGMLFAGAPGAAFGVGRVYRFDPSTGAFAGVIPPAGAAVAFGVALAARGDGLLIGEPDHPAIPDDPLGRGAGRVHLVDAASGAFRWTFADPVSGADDVAFGGTFVAVGPYVVVGDPTPGAVFAFADLPHCGDGTLDAGERCDDGNLASGDGCDANCTPTGCGNAVTTAGEVCDDGNRTDGDACSATCLQAETHCGDGVKEPTELCDDGNLVDGDGCDSNCTPTGCGNGIVTAGEDCDDGNTSDGDACPHDCNQILCGDGVVEGGEECDDGNAIDGDGCSPFCVRVAGPYGVGVTDLTVTYHSAILDDERSIETRVYYPSTANAPIAISDVPHDVPTAPGRFPLVLDSHGFGAPSFESTLYNPRAYFLARNGFIVASPFHPADSLLDFPQVLGWRPQDLRAVLDRLLDPRETPAVLRHHVDSDRIGAMGHSLGGITATATSVDGFFGSVRDPRIKAVYGSGSENYIFNHDELATSRVPIMLVIGDLDPYFGGPASIQSTYQLHQAPRFLVEIPYADHALSIVTAACALPFCHHLGAVRYPLAFFRTYLGVDPAVAALLQPGAEAEFGDVSYFRDPGPRLFLGGTSRRDCMVALASTDGDGLDENPVRTLACTDGAACDTDPAPGQCGIDVGLCLNVVDRRAIACAPTDVASVRVQNPSADPELAALQDAVDAVAPTSDRRCTTPVRLTVRTSSRRGSAERRVRVVAADAAGHRDADTFVLRCERP
jgi:cysteine-rich repeat protein